MSKRILLADDSAAARTSVEQTLGTSDYQILTAEDGRSAMEQINTLRPHLVLVHAMLPEIDGYEVCRQVKETPDTSHIPVLLLTGTFEPFDINRAKEVRYDGFVTKPVDGPEFLALVARCIDHAVYPAADPVPEEAPEPDIPLETEVEAPEVAKIQGDTAEDGTGGGPDAMLDRIFPEQTVEDFSPDGETVTLAESSEEDFFSIVESAETVTECGTEPDQSGAAGSTAEKNGGETVAEHKKPEGSDEDSDLSWFLRKYEEKQQSADVETEELPPDSPTAVEDEALSTTAENALTAADPFNVETDNDAPAGEELTIGTEPEPRADEENEPEKEAVEPLPFGVETPVTDQTAAPVELDDQQLERISRRVVELLSESVVREVAWETVPEIAERLIRERIRDIEAEADTSN